MFIDLLDNLPNGRLDIFGKEEEDVVLHVIPMEYLPRSFTRSYLHMSAYYFYKDVEGKIWLDYAGDEGIYRTILNDKNITKVYIPTTEYPNSELFVQAFEFGNHNKVGDEFITMLSLAESMPVEFENVPVHTLLQPSEGVVEEYEEEETPIEEKPIQDCETEEELVLDIAPTVSQESDLPTAKIGESLFTTETPREAILDTERLEEMDNMLPKDKEPDEAYFSYEEDEDTVDAVEDEGLENEEVSEFESNSIIEEEDIVEEASDIIEEDVESIPTEILEPEEEEENKTVSWVSISEPESKVEVDENDTLPWFLSMPEMEESSHTHLMESTEPEAMSFEAELDFGDQTLDDVLEEVHNDVEKEQSKEEYPYFINRKDALAEGQYDKGEGFVVFEGSRICPTVAPSCLPKIKAKRAEAEMNGWIKDNYTTKTLVFSTANEASGFVLGSNPGNRMNWTTVNGITLKEQTVGVEIPEYKDVKDDRQNLFIMNRQGMESYLYFDKQNSAYWLLNGSRVAEIIESETPTDIQELRYVFRNAIAETGYLKESIRFATAQQATTFIAGKTGVKTTNWKNKMNLRLPDVEKESIQ